MAQSWSVFVSLDRRGLTISKQNFFGKVPNGPWHPLPLALFFGRKILQIFSFGAFKGVKMAFFTMCKTHLAVISLLKLLRKIPCKGLCVSILCWKSSHKIPKSPPWQLTQNSSVRVLQGFPKFKVLEHVKAKGWMGLIGWHLSEISIKWVCS